MDATEFLTGGRNALVYLFLSWGLATMWGLVAISMMIEAKLSVVEGTIAVGLAIAAGMFAAFTPQFAAVVFIVMTALTVTTPIIRTAWNKREHRLVDADIARRHTAAIHLNPNMVHSRLMLSELCYNAGLLCAAVAHLEAAIQPGSPQFASEKITLKSWKRDLESGAYPLTLKCPSCGRDCAPDTIRCPNCHADVLYQLIAGFWFPQGLLPRLLKVWFVTLVVVGLGLLTSVKLPPAAAVPITTAIIVMGFMWFVRTVRRESTMDGH